MILTTNSAVNDVATRAGGKGHNLIALAQRGLSVPPFFVLAVDAFDAALAGAQLDLHKVDVAAAGDAVRALAMPPAIDQVIRAALSSLSLPVAVRSSALAEDSRLHSFAGQLQTFLYVESADAVVDAVKKCWASAFSAHALAYMKQHGIPVSAARVAVVVQSMVDADVAGVAFTADPTSGDADTIVISSVLGLGEGLVSGLLDSDDVRVDKGTRALRDRKVAHKDKRLLRSPGGGVREEVVPAAQRDVASLDDAGVRELVDVALAVEAHYGAPQDIEWAVSKGKLYLLQARPITTPLAGQKPVQIWDNSNIIESYFGVTSPLTFTFAKNAYHSVYVQFCEVMGVPRSVIVNSDDVLKNMLGYVDGRIYYNLLHWYHLIGLFPGFKHNKSFMEGMMGVRESLPADAQALLQLPAPATLGERVSQALLGVSMARRFLTLDSIVAGFRAHFDDNYERYRRVRFDGKSFEELMHMQSALEGVFLANWKAPIINDFFAMMAFGALRKLVSDWGLDPAGTLQNDLLCGEGGVESAVPT
ncbi:MAG TPA: PEP/pyruvate-binding domain-containing protein, partial [Myxococcota bacterium]